VIRRNRNTTRVTLVFALAAILLALAVAPALAAPEFGVEVSRAQTNVSHDDERIEYTVEVENTAPAKASVEIGDTLGCVSPEWSPTDFNSELIQPDEFDFEWRRNGEAIPAATTETYTTTAADAEMAIQCLIKGTNPFGSSKFASLPAVVVGSQPATAPPAPSDLSFEARPEITNEAGESRVELEKGICHPPENWTPGTAYASYQWLRNGILLAGPEAKTSEYQPVAADEETVLQCEVIGTNAGGSVVGVSSASPVDVDASKVHARFPSLFANDQPGITLGNFTSDVVTLDFELPGGEETFAHKILRPGTDNQPPDGWDCSSQPAFSTVNAKVTCTRSNILVAGSSYPGVKVNVYPGPDAPNLAVAKATVSGGGALAPGIGEDIFTFDPSRPFDIETFDASISADPAQEVDYTKAGGHPIAAGVSLRFTSHQKLTQEAGNILLRDRTPNGHLKDTYVDTARGLVGNALTVPQPCPTIEEVVLKICPAGSAVGGIEVTLPGINFPAPIYSIEPEYGAPAQFAFIVGEGAFGFVPRLRADEGYAITFEAPGAPERALPMGAEPVLCGFGFKEFEEITYPKTKTICFASGEPGSNPSPLITNPTRCSGPPPTQGLRVNSWEHPADFKTKEAGLPQITECENVKFEPEVKLTPTNREADSPTGLDVEIEMPTDGLLDDQGVAQAMLDNAIITLPEGMTVNPSSANGLGACSLAQIKFHSNEAEECPEASRIGTVEIETPLIRETLHGSVYLAKQNDNPFNSAFGLYMSFSSDRDGVRVKVAGKLVPDPVTGQLVSTFAENPEWPFSRLELHFNSGPRAPLVNPPSCGTYAIHSELSPWSAVNPANPTPDEIVAHDDTYQVTSGPNGSACPTNALDPKLKAGVANPTAAAKSPFVFSLSREDGTQRFAAVDVANPKGLTAYLKGIPYCPESALASISGAEETGRTEYASPSCPAQSQVGTVAAGSGAGPFPFYVDTGRVYLAGPYKGAPVSLAAITPAVAGPYDLGSVLVRVPLYVDPVSSQVVAKSDPIPTALHGIVLDVRDIRLALNRPGFTAAPTSCEPGAVEATVTGQQGAVAKVANRFQVGGCDALGFKPKLQMRLFGGTKRGAHPKFRTILTPRPGDANIASASVALPHSEFLDQAHIRTVCTRVQFAAKQCPAGSIYGFAEATTPLLDQPVSGPAYLRSSDNQLPDLVMALRGPDSQPIEVHVVGRIDSVNGGIRSSFDVVPDQPVTSFTLTMQGGKKGLLVNSRDICEGKTDKATAKFTAHNGKTLTLRSQLRNACKGSARKGKGAKKKHKH
jgi:hypothetical protein